MYKNIIFDLGGVMVDFAPKDFLLDRFCNAAIEDKVYRLTFGSETWQKLDAGLCTRYEGNQAMMAAAQEEGCAFEVQEVLENWASILRVRRRMVELVRRLKNHGYCAYYLSNIPEDILPLLMSRGLEGVFDGGVASCDVHINKPGRRVHLHRRQPRQRPDGFSAGDEQHPDAGKCGHLGPQPGHLQRHTALTQKLRFRGNPFLRAVARQKSFPPNIPFLDKMER